MAILARYRNNKSHFEFRCTVVAPQRRAYSQTSEAEGLPGSVSTGRIGASDHAQRRFYKCRGSERTSTCVTRTTNDRFGIETEQKLESWPDENVHSEHFSVPTPGNPFVVKLATSGKEIHVGEHQSILEALEQAGVDAPYLCRGGACGQCITRITNTEGGAVHHNDHYLTDEEKKEGDRIATCVSRMDGGCLTLDL